MRLLIDGNNLLHASDVFPPGNNRSPQGAQETLVAALQAGMTPQQAAQTVIVFDGRGTADEPFPTLGIQVRHPRRGKEADDLIEELLAAAKEPKRVTVVSSDHRIQRAARQVGATAVDSEVYWRKWKEQTSWSQSGGAPVADDKPAAPAEDEVQEWVARFGRAKD